MERKKTKIKARLLVLWSILLSGLFSGKAMISDDLFMQIYCTICTILCYLIIIILALHSDIVERK